MENTIEKQEEISGIIKLRPYYGHQQGACILQPVRDQFTGLIQGAKIWTAFDKANSKEDVFEITAEMEFRIEDGTIFNLAIPRERAIWNCIKHCKQIGQNREEAHSDPRILYYREDLEGDLDKKLTVSELKYKAESFIRNGSSARRKEVMILLGKKVEYMTDKNIDDYLVDLARDPKGYLELLKLEDQFEKGTAKPRLFLKTVIAKKIIRVDSNKMHYFGDIFLGANEDQVIYYLKNPDNSTIITQIKFMLNPDNEKDNT